MISIRRGRGPRALHTQRVRRLPALCEHVDSLGANDSLSDEYFVGYQVARDDLWQQQRGKCAYCERPIEIKKSALPVEHFRPKAIAKRSESSTERGYWWLAWTWENLLVACHRCNTGNKGIWFPLADGSPTLPPGQNPPGDEKALLLDPSAEDCDPLDSIDFILVPAVGEVSEKWKPVARYNCPRGAATIERLGLDKLIPRYTDWVRDHLNSDIGDIESLLASEQISQARERWQRLLRERYNPSAKYRALTWCVLNRRFPSERRASLEFELERPISSRPAPKNEDERCAAARLKWEAELLDELSPTARDLVYKLGLNKAKSEADWWPAIQAALAMRSYSLAELARLFSREENAMRQRLGGLVRKNLVIEEGDATSGWRYSLAAC